MTFIAGDAGHIAEHNRITANLGWGAWTGFVAAGGTFGTNFTDYGGALRAVQIRRSLDLVNVQLRGVGKATGAIVVGATILTVPSGYRPTATEVFAMGTDRSATQQYCRVDIASTGVITFAASGNLASGELISFSGMAWSTA